MAGPTRDDGRSIGDAAARTKGDRHPRRAGCAPGARHAAGTGGHLASQLRQHANGMPVADRKSLQRTIRRWEIGQNEVSDRYGLLLRGLGYPEVSVDASDVRWLAERARRTGA